MNLTDAMYLAGSNKSSHSLAGAAIFLVILAAGLLAAGWVWRKRYAAMFRTTTLTCAELTGRGPMAVECEVTGTVGPSDEGLLTAPFSGTPCVWYRAEAKAKHRTSGNNTFFKERTDRPFALWDGTGTIEVQPDGSTVDGMTKSFDAKLSPAEQGALPGPTGRPEEYRHYHYEEWTLPPGAHLYARGKATFDGRRLVMRSPTEEPKVENPYLLSTRTEKQLRRRALMMMTIGYGGGALLVTLTVVLMVIGLVTD